MATSLGTIAHQIRGDREYTASIREIEHLLALEPRPGSPGDDRLDLLSVLVEAYEAERGYDLPDASPQELVDFMLDEKGMTRASLAEMGGRVTTILTQGEVSRAFPCSNARAVSSDKRRPHTVTLIVTFGAGNGFDSLPLEVLAY